MTTGYINIGTLTNANGTTDNTTAIQNAINGSSPGDEIYFPRGTYLVSQTIKLLKSRRYMGAHREQTTIKQKNGSNLDAVLADETWLSGTVSQASNPIDIEGIGIDGNSSNQSSGRGIGIALISFWNALSDLEIQNTRGDGIQLSSARRDGVEVSNTPVEMHLSRIDVRNAGGYGIRVYDPTPAQQSVTDGWMRDCVVQSPTFDGIRIDSGAGWLVQGCHLYGVTQNGIHVGRADSTRILGNYIESYGYSSTPGYYSAIALGDGIDTWIGSSNPSVIANNSLFMSYGVAPGTQIYGISTNCSNSVTANVVISGNGLVSNGNWTGINLSNQGVTSITNAVLSGNLVQQWATSLATIRICGTINVS